MPPVRRKGQAGRTLAASLALLAWPGLAPAFDARAARAWRDVHPLGRSRALPHAVPLTTAGALLSVSGAEGGGGFAPAADGGAGDAPGWAPGEGAWGLGDGQAARADAENRHGVGAGAGAGSGAGAGAGAGAAGPRVRGGTGGGAAQAANVEEEEEDEAAAMGLAAPEDEEEEEEEDYSDEFDPFAIPPASDRPGDGGDDDTGRRRARAGAFAIPVPEDFDDDVILPTGGIFGIGSSDLDDDDDDDDDDEDSATSNHNGADDDDDEDARAPRAAARRGGAADERARRGDADGGGEDSAAWPLRRRSELPARLGYRRGDSPDEDAWQSSRPRYEAKYLDAHELNARFAPAGLDRLRFAVTPDAALAAIVPFHLLVEPFPFEELAAEAWEEAVGTDPTPLLAELSARPFTFALRAAVERTLRAEPPAVQQAHIRTATAAYARLFDAAVARHLARGADALAPGVRSLIETLSLYEVRLALTADAPAASVRAALRLLGLCADGDETGGAGGVFGAVVCADESEDEGQMFLQAAELLERPPRRCAVLDVTLRSALQAHEVLMKSICLTHRLPLYALKPADLVLASLSELTMISLRSLFERDERSPTDGGYELEREPLRKTDRWGDTRNARRTLTLDPPAPPPSAEEELPWLYGGGNGDGGDGGGGGAGGGGGKGTGAK